MAEWLNAHAWKLIPVALSNAHRHAPTHSPSTTSRNNDVHQSVPVKHRVRPGFQGVSDTVLTQCRCSLKAKHTETYERAGECAADGPGRIPAPDWRAGCATAPCAAASGIEVQASDVCAASLIVGEPSSSGPCLRNAQLDHLPEVDLPRRIGWSALTHQLGTRERA